MFGGALRTQRIQRCLHLVEGRPCELSQLDVTDAVGNAVVSYTHLLHLRAEIKCPGGKCKEFTLVNLNTGAIPTNEQAAVLAGNDEAAKAALAKEFGLTVAYGLICKDTFILLFETSSFFAISSIFFPS